MAEILLWGCTECQAAYLGADPPTSCLTCGNYRRWVVILFRSATHEVRTVTREEWEEGGGSGSIREPYSHLYAKRVVDTGESG